MENEEIAYLILQDMYLKQKLGKDEYTEEEILFGNQKYFPDEWFFNSVEVRLNIISKAIKENRDLVEVYERETNVDMLPPRLGDK
ncbi:MAG: hypothetical protein IJG97_02360 [Bacilli bacterium]|nr:hypothetical protein [Bacilli bacterium]